jgi:hypothetical protein
MPYANQLRCGNWNNKGAISFGKRKIEDDWHGARKLDNVLALIAPPCPTPEATVLSIHGKHDMKCL